MSFENVEGSTSEVNDVNEVDEVNRAANEVTGDEGGPEYSLEDNMDKIVGNGTGDGGHLNQILRTDIPGKGEASEEGNEKSNSVEANEDHEIDELNGAANELTGDEGGSEYSLEDNMDKIEGNETGDGGHLNQILVTDLSDWGAESGVDGADGDSDEVAEGKETDETGNDASEATEDEVGPEYSLEDNMNKLDGEDAGDGMSNENVGRTEVDSNEEAADAESEIQEVSVLPGMEFFAETGDKPASSDANEDDEHSEPMEKEQFTEIPMEPNPEQQAKPEQEKSKQDKFFESLKVDVSQSPTMPEQQVKPPAKTNDLEL